MKKQTYKDKMDESLSMRHGKESTKKQSYVDRRHESEGADHHHKHAMHHLKEHMKHMKHLHRMAKKHPKM